MPSDRTYHHLSAEERAVIMIERQRGASQISIASYLQRSPAAISRELKRAGSGSYDAAIAARGYRRRRLRSVRRRRLLEGTTLYRLVYPG